jgi:hypothetical protein
MVISKNNTLTSTSLDKKKKISLVLDIGTFDIFCRYILQNHVFVKMEHLVNLRKLMYMLDPSTYENDPEKVKRVNFILRGLEGRLDEAINDRDIVLNYINGGLTYALDFIDYNKLDLSKDEILYIHKLVSETLQFEFVYNYIDEYQDILTRFKTCDFMNRGPIVQEFESLIDRTKNSYRHSRVNDNATDMTFSLQPGIFENCITDAYNTLTSPNRRLICGMQGMNELTGGGFESSRVYLLLGTSGVGKSLTLLNLIYQIKKANPFYKTKDPTKKPCIVLLTMENTVIETISRLFALVCEGSGNMGNYSIDEVLHILRTEGQLFVNDSSPIDIIIKYKANKSVDTSYLYTLYDDLQDEGYEMIMLVQDHIKRIKSIYGNSDVRLELGDVMNEFKTFAIDKDIPVLTNSHLNRDAARVLEEAERKGNQDTGRLIGKSNTGESMLMIENVDCGIVITLDFDKDGNRYMCFKLTKMRDDGARDYIAQPFALGSKIRLLEDLGGIPQFKDTIHMAPEIKRSTVMKTSGASAAMFSDFDNVLGNTNSDNIFTKDTFNLVETNKPIESAEDLIVSIDEIRSQLNAPKTEVTCPIIFKGEIPVGY